MNACSCFLSFSVLLFTIIWVLSGEDDASIYEPRSLSRRQIERNDANYRGDEIAKFKAKLEEMPLEDAPRGASLYADQEYHMSPEYHTFAKWTMPVAAIIGITLVLLTLATVVIASRRLADKRAKLLDQNYKAELYKQLGKGLSEKGRHKDKLAPSAQLFHLSNKKRLVGLSSAQTSQITSNEPPLKYENGEVGDLITITTSSEDELSVDNPLFDKDIERRHKE